MYVYTYIICDTHIHTYAHPYRHDYVSGHSCVCVCVNCGTCTHVSLCMHVVYVSCAWYGCINVQMCDIDTYIHIHTVTHIYTSTHIHTDMSTRAAIRECVCMNHGTCAHVSLWMYVVHVYRVYSCLCECVHV